MKSEIDEPPCETCLKMPICRNRTYSDNWIKCSDLRAYVVDVDFEAHWYKRKKLKPHLRKIF